ncbi:MAG: hypothetical protein M1544_00295 [Candidatus Marsarchaeota archaeon]|nr:hypothetical protein [Candidatus Marsarchaeota archaeon]MCL5101787.1 hypothetical protein [Candidatus Marsarchaeota archaeon]
MEQNTSTEARTTIDTMLELIRAKGRMDLNSVASSLGIAPSVVEGWAKVLESGNLIKISYEVGKMFLSPIELSKEDLQALETKTEQKKFILSEELESEVISAEKLDESLKGLGASMQAFEARLQKESPEAHKKVEELSKMYSQLRSYQANIDSIKKSINSDYDAMEKRFDEVIQKANKVAEQEQKAKGGIPQTIQENLNAAKAAIQEVETVKKNIASSIESTRKDLENQLKQEDIRLNQIIKQSKEQLEASFKELEKESGMYKGNIKELKELQLSYEQLSKKLNQEHSEFNANYSKLEQGLKGALDKFTPKYEEALNELNKAMENAGSIGEIVKNMSDLKAEIADLEPKLGTYRQELQRIKDQVDALNAAKNISATQKDDRLKELENRSNAISEDISNKKTKIKKSIKNIQDLTSGNKDNGSSKAHGK